MAIDPPSLDEFRRLYALINKKANASHTHDNQGSDAELTAIAGLTSAADTLPYFTGSGTAGLTGFTAAARALLDDVDAAAMRTTLGVGSGGGDASTNTATSVDSEVVVFSGTGGKTLKRATGSGIAKITSGVLGTATAGTDYVAPDAELTAIAGLTSASDTLPYFTGSGTAGLTGFTAAARALLDDADAAAMRTTLGVGSGGGDASTNTATSVDSEVVVFSGTGGKTLKRATGSGIAKITSGVLGTATAGTDYYAPGSTDVAITDGGTGASTLPSGLLKGAGTSAITAAAQGTDYYAPAGTDVAITDGGTGVSTLPSGLLKGAGTGAITAATAGTDYYNPGGTDVALTDGGTGASTASAARTNLGLIIGTDVQPQDPELAAIAGLTSAANKLPYFTGSGTAALTDLTAAGRALIDDADATAQRVTLGFKSYNVDTYGADPTGVGFSDTAVDAALTALGTNPGILEFGVGTYKLATTKTLARPGQGIRGQGQGATKIVYTGTGDCLRVWDSTVSTSGTVSPGIAGPIFGLTIDGTSNTNSSIVGLHIGDLSYVNIQNVLITGFDNTGSKGFWGENRYSWSERAYIQMDVESCLDCYVFARHGSHPNALTSWMYSTYILGVGTYANNQNGVTLVDCQMIAVELNIQGNCGSFATNTGVVLTVGTDGTDLSSIEGHLRINVETDTVGATIGPKDINIGASAYIAAYGLIKFAQYGTDVFQAGTANWGTVTFSGPVWCPSLNASLSPNGVVSNMANGVLLGTPCVRAASATSVTANPGIANLYEYTALASALTIAQPGDLGTGNTPNGTPLDFRLTDNGTTRALTWSSAFRVIGTTLPTATTANKTVYVHTRYNLVAGKWDVLDVRQQA